MGIYLEQIISAQNGRRAGDQWSIQCPAHSDAHHSASLTEDGDKILVVCHAGCTQARVIEALKAKNLWPERKERKAEYFYHNLAGEKVHRKVRIDRADAKKDYTQAHFKDGEWVDSSYPGELLPYDCLNWSAKDGTIFLVEGEKCANVLIEKGLLATTTGGASDWRKYYARHFKSRSVIILPDNDDPGKDYAAKAYDDISKVARDCYIVQLPDLKPKQDVYDWLRSGHSTEELLGLAKSARDKSLIEFTTLKNLKPIYSSGNLISGLIDSNNQSCLYGDANVGKSFIALDMALHIAQGKDWFGKTTKKGAVLYIAAEAGPSIAQRAEAFQLHYQIKGQDLPFAAVLSSVDMFDKAADTTRIIEGIRALERQFDEKCELVIIDTLSKAIAGANENAAQDMNAFLFNVDRIRHQAQTHVMIVHHSGKDTSKGARGHSSLRAAMDTEIEVFDGGMRLKKQRNIKIEAQPICFKLTEVPIGFTDEGLPATSCVIEPKDFQNNVIRKAKTSERALQALECLKHAIEHHPVAPQVNTQSPIGTKTTSVKRWKELFLTRHMLGVERRSSNDMAFKRAAEALQAKQFVGVDGDYCWLIDDGHKSADDAE